MSEVNITSIWETWLPKLQGQRVALYGAGEHTLMLENLLGSAFYQMPITCIIDQKPQSSSLLGFPVLKREECDFSSVDYIIVSSKSAEQEIVDSLKPNFTLDKIFRFYKLSHNDIFSKIHDDNHWGDESSVSGPGSSEVQTKKISDELPKLFKELTITNLLDIPCGDFNWMQHVINENIHYQGGDIVEKLVLRNNKLYQSNLISFSQLDILTARLPKKDAIFCRDCLVHFSYHDIQRALQNIIKSDSTYFITTTFTQRTSNENIQTGGWRPLNLCIEPFYFPAPIKIIVEGCTENKGIYHDKALAVWRVSDLASCISGDNKT